MIRNLKVLVLALVALTASSALAASAQATTVKSVDGTYPVVLTGAQENENVFKVANIRSVSCAEAALTGELAAGPQASVSVTAAYAKCTSVPSSLPATGATNSCSYKFTPNTPSGTTGSGTISLECTKAGDEVVLAIYGGTPHSEVKCQYGITPQSAKGTVEYHNIGAGTTSEITLTLNLKEISTKVLVGTALLCGGKAGETKTATYTGNLKLTGETVGKAHKGIVVGH